MAQHKTITTTATLLAFTLTGCATHRENMPISQELLAKPSSVVITQISGLEKPGYYKLGNQGILDFVVNDMIAGSMPTKIESIDANTIVEGQYYTTFGNAFANKAFQVKKESAPLIKAKLISLDGDATKAPYDFKPLKAKYGVEYALVLDPKMFGVQRTYYGMIPTSAPSGIADFGIYLVKLDDNSIVGNYNAKVNLSANGDWDTPPDYTALTKSTKDSLEKGLNAAYIGLMGCGN